MTYGTLGYGFFRDTVQFRRKVLYWHIIPSCTELGFRSPGIPAPESMASFAEGSRIQDQLIFTASAAEMVKCRSPA
ncbi:MAG: hypothetical protein ABSB80_04295 [Methanoregula sp.]|uniref:hypothetical protein n=1 Tax=Methanoregula sp. TaxID=2052170 RepID=UPI003D0FF6CD